MNTILDSNPKFANAFIDMLYALGVEDFCVCPGSRSTPLTSAIAKHPHARSHVFFDERSAAFATLGFGKAGTLAALVVTSGTAVANAYPAVVEASMSSTPMLVLSGDRPPELRETHANQTIDQNKIFQGYTRFFFDFPCPHPELDAHFLQSTLSYAVWHCTGLHAGPVHLNCMFREPFSSLESTETSVWYNLCKYSHPQIQISIEDNLKLLDICNKARKGLLVIGELSNSSDQAMAEKICNHINWPCVVDVGSGLRLHSIKRNIFAIETFLKTNKHIPDLILHLGAGISSKTYEDWIKQHAIHQIVIDKNPIRIDPSNRSQWRIFAEIQHMHTLQRIQSTSYLLGIISAYNQKVLETLDSILEEPNSISEIQLAQNISNVLPSSAKLFVGNSMPIRDLNNFAMPLQPMETSCNRGASGIDGIIATAFGWSLVDRSPTAVLLGDVSSIHDWSSVFSIASLYNATKNGSTAQYKHSFVIIVINNSGGSIFSMLPISKELPPEQFGRLFTTEHEHTFTNIAQSMGITALQVITMDTLEQAISTCFAKQGLSLIEIISNREKNVHDHQQIHQILLPFLEQLT